MPLNRVNLITFKQSFCKEMKKRLTVEGNTENKKQIAEAILVGTAAGTAFIPVAGPFISLGLLALTPAVKAGISYNDQRNKENAEALHDKLFSDFAQGVEKEIEITADEIVRIFEYQIESLSSGIDNLAENAVNRIIGYKPEQYTAKYGTSDVPTYQRFIRALFDNSEEKGSRVSVEAGKWQSGSVFKKSGIRKLEDKEYKFYSTNAPAGQEMRAEKYGFREYREYLDNITGVTLQLVDVTPASYQEHTSFKPSTILVSSKEMIDFAMDTEISLVNFVKSKHGITVDFRVVYQGTEELKDANGSPISLSWKDLSYLIAIHSNFERVNFDNAILHGTEFVFANIDKSSFLKSSFDGKTKFYFAVCSSATRFHASAFVDIAQDHHNFSDVFQAYIRELENAERIVTGIKGLEQAVINGQLTDAEKSNRIQEREVLRTQLEKALESLQVLKNQLGNEKMKSYIPSLAYDYVERRSVSNDIREHLKSTNVLILHGFPGVGKSQLAINYATQASTSSMVVRYFNGESGNIEESERDTIKDFSELAKLSGAGERRKAVIDLLKDREFILVFDNVHSGESARPVEDYIEGLKSSRGKIIITTNNGNLFPRLKQSNLLKQQDVNGLSEDEAKEFLSILETDEGTRNELANIAREVEYNTLALKAAKEFLLTYEISVESYLANNKNVVSTLTDENLSVGDRNVHASIINLFMRYDHSTQEAVKILSFLKTDQIPGFLLRGVQFRENVPEVFISKLMINSFVSKNGKEMFSLHSLLQKCVKENIRIDAEHQAHGIEYYLAKVVQLIVDFSTKDTRALSDKNRMEKLLPHIEEVAKNIEDFINTADISTPQISELKLYYAKLINFKAYIWSVSGRGVKAVEISQHSVDLINEVVGIVRSDDAAAIYEKLIRFKVPFRHTSVTHKNIEFLKSVIASKQLHALSDLTQRDLEISAATGVPIKDETYRELASIGLAISEEQLKNTHLVELYMSVCYTLGRGYLYIRDDRSTPPDALKNLLGYMELQRELGRILFDREGLRISFKRLAEVVSLPIIYDGKIDIDKPQASDIETLTSITSGLEEALVDTEFYSEYGVYRMGSEDSFSKMKIHEYLMKFYIKLAVIDGDNSLSHKNKADEHYAKCLVITGSGAQSGNMRLASLYNSFGEYWLLKARLGDTDDIKKSALEEAKKAYNKAYAIDKAKENGKGLEDFPLADAILGLAKVKFLAQEKNISLVSVAGDLDVSVVIQELVLAKKIYVKLHKHSKVDEVTRIISTLCHNLHLENPDITVAYVTEQIYDNMIFGNIKMLGDAYKIGGIDLVNRLINIGADISDSGVKTVAEISEIYKKGIEEVKDALIKLEVLEGLKEQKTNEHLIGYLHMLSTYEDGNDVFMYKSTVSAEELQQLDNSVFDKLSGWFVNLLNRFDYQADSDESYNLQITFLNLMYEMVAESGQLNFFGVPRRDPAPNPDDFGYGGGSNEQLPGMHTSNNTNATGEIM